MPKNSVLDLASSLCSASCAFMFHVFVSFMLSVKIVIVGLIVPFWLKEVIPGDLCLLFHLASTH